MLTHEIEVEARIVVRARRTNDAEEAVRAALATLVAAGVIVSFQTPQDAPDEWD